MAETKYIEAIYTLTEFVPDKSYSKGQIVTRKGKFYRAIRDIEEGHEWNRDDWCATKYDEYAKKDDAEFINFEGIHVKPSAWQEWRPNGREEFKIYKVFPYRTCIACNGVTADMIPLVIFSTSDALSGNFSNIAESVDKGVYIYCKEKPTDEIIVPLVKCAKNI